MVAGDVDAWHELWAVAEGVIWAVTGNPRIFGPLARRQDDRREVVVRVMHRLREDDFARLRTFLDEAGARAERAFRPWLVVLTTRAAIDHLRAHEHYRDRRGGDRTSRWIVVTQLDEGAGELERPIGIEDIATARKALRYAKDALRDDQCAALEAWLEGRDADEIAQRLGLSDREAAKRLVRSSLKRLRDHYGQIEPLESPT